MGDRLGSCFRGSGLSLPGTVCGGRGGTKEVKEEVRRVNWELVTVAVGVIMLVLAILLRVLGVY